MANRKRFITNSAPNPAALCTKLDEASQQGFSVITIAFNPEPPDPDSKWTAFLEMEVEGDS